MERGGIGDVRQYFWPLRTFTDLDDVNRQARQWLHEVANQRQHRETQQRPSERFQPQALRPLPALLPDYPDTATVLVQPDMRVYFDGNRYRAPPALVGEQLTLKADSHTVTLYHQHRQIVSYARCWRLGPSAPQSSRCARFRRRLRRQSPAPATVAAPPAAAAAATRSRAQSTGHRSGFAGRLQCLPVARKERLR